MRQIADRTWKTPGVEVLRETAVTQLEITYIGILQATVAQWVALRPIFEVCAEDKGCEGGRRSREACWLQEAAEKQLRATLVEILWEAQMRRRRGERATQ